MQMKELFDQYAQPGVIAAISVRPKRREPTNLLNSVLAIENRGLESDRSKGGKRQVTLIQKEHLHTVSSILGRPVVDFRLTRRNLLVEGINLLSLKGKRFQVGEAILEYSGECHPCSRMEEALGQGGYNAMRGHGGITARIVKSGLISKGDKLNVLFSSWSSAPTDLIMLFGPQLENL